MMMLMLNAKMPDGSRGLIARGEELGTFSLTHKRNSR